MFAYQPAALGDILLAHKSFDVLRRACRCCCCWERRKLAGAADVSIAVASAASYSGALLPAAGTS